MSARDSLLRTTSSGGLRGGIALFLLLAGCTPERPPPAGGGVKERPAADSPLPAKPQLTQALRERGKELYSRNCAACHGESGRGDGPAAYLLYPRPRDFSRGLFRLVSTANSVPSDEDLFRTISRGMPGSSMPAWEHLPAESRWALVAEVRRLALDGMVESMLREQEAQGFPMERAEALEIATEALEPAAVLEVPPETPNTLEHLARGKLLYLQNCAPCHDADGRGRMARDLVDADGLPIFARDFTLGIFKGAPTGRQIACRMLAGMPGTPMPSYLGIFQNRPEDLWAIIHHVQSLVPPGAQDRVLQRQRRIRVARVAGPLALDPDAPVWDSAPSTYVALMPLWWRDERIEGVLVRALWDGNHIALKLSWIDPTEDRLALRTEQFSDGAAVQISTAADPPFFAMGDRQGVCSIWHWKAHWEGDLEGFKDVETIYPHATADHSPFTKDAGPERTSAPGLPTAAASDPAFLTAFAAANAAANPKRPSAVESLVASGFGTLTNRGPAFEHVRGASRWDRGTWHVILMRPIAAGDGALEFKTGRPSSIAFAVWDGSTGDRNGQKSVSIWHSLKLETQRSE